MASLPIAVKIMDRVNGVPLEWSMTKPSPDRRGCLRSRTHVPLWINHMREEVSVHERCLLACDISQEGVFVETRRPWPVGSTVMVEQVFGVATDAATLPDWIEQGRYGTVVRKTPEGMGIHLNPVDIAA